VNCPSCESSLIENEIQTYTVFSCDNCNGIWVPGSQIKRILREQSMPPSMNAIPVLSEGGDEYETKRLCSKHRDIKLKAHSVRGVEIDICNECNGVFFDKNEFEEVFRSQEKSTSTKVAEYTALEIVFQMFLGIFR